MTAEHAAPSVPAAETKARSSRGPTDVRGQLNPTWVKFLTPLSALLGVAVAVQLLPAPFLSPLTAAALALALQGLLGLGLAKQQRGSGSPAHVVQSLREVDPYLHVMGEQLDGAVQQCEQDVLAVVESLSRVHVATSDQVARIEQSTEDARNLAQVLDEKIMLDQQLCAILEVFVHKQEKDVEGNTERVRRLQEVKELAPLVDVIAEVARHTNILAINAAIEAARAGESGRGFAVVAGEVRRLSTQTAQVAIEIAEKIRIVTEGIDHEVAEAIQNGAIEGSSNNMRKVLADVSEMHDRFASASASLQADHGIHAGNDAIRHALSEALGMIQFQDVMRQRVGHVQHALQTLNQHMQGLADDCGQPSRSVSPHQSLKEVLDIQRSEYVMDSQRATHAKATLPDSASVSRGHVATERPAIELF